jgi:1,4-dihydroxy-2-naphthoyl-CoA hydrolase
MTAEFPPTAANGSGGSAFYPVGLDQHFDALYGLELREMGEDLVRARVSVRDTLKQPTGIVHGGVYASIAEGICSIGTTLAVLGHGKLAIGLSNHTTFLRPITTGSIDAAAVPLHRGRTTWLWDVRFLDDGGRLCAVAQVCIAVRDRPARSAGAGNARRDQHRPDHQGGRSANRLDDP